MALRFIDGADYYPSGDLGLKWTSFSNQGISSTTRFSLGQSISLSGVGRIQVTIDAQGTWIIGCAVKYPVVGGNGGALGSLLMLLSGTTVVAELRINNAGIMSVMAYDNGAVGHTICTGTTQLKPIPWYYIEWKFICGATINVTNTTVKLNGATECSFTATSGGSTSAATTANIIKLNGPLNATYLFDDIYVCDGTGGAYNDFLGDCRIATQRPSADGYSSQWTPNTGTNFSRVNETTENGDTSYVSTNTATNIDSYTMSALPTTPTSILAVQANAVAKNDAGSHTFQINTRISSTNYTSSTFTLTGSYAIYSQLQTASPATSSAWTNSEVTNYEIGLNLIS